MKMRIVAGLCGASSLVSAVLAGMILGAYGQQKGWLNLETNEWPLVPMFVFMGITVAIGMNIFPSTPTNPKIGKNTTTMMSCPKPAACLISMEASAMTPFVSSAVRDRLRPWVFSSILLTNNFSRVKLWICKNFLCMIVRLLPAYDPVS